MAQVVQQPPVVQPPVQRPSTNAVLVHRSQTQNPILKRFHNISWQYADIPVDYQVGLTTGVLFLSLKYHRLHPEYIHTRIEKLQKKYSLRILLLMCDVGDQHEQPIRELTKTCLINELTIVMAWSYEEAAMYLHTYKAYEHKSADSIKERVDKDYNSLLRASLTTIKSVNKTDVTTLRTHFGSFANIAKATSEELSNCPGIGGVKVRRLNEAFNQPFRKSAPIKAKSKDPSSAAGVTGLTGVGIGRTQDGSGAAPNKALASSSKSMPPPPAPRQLSPDWDIDLDLNSDIEEVDDTPVVQKPPPWEMDVESDSDVDEPPPTKKGKGKGAPRESPIREYSPDWDISLDLNQSDDEDDPPRERSPPRNTSSAPSKKRRPNPFAS